MIISQQRSGLLVVDVQERLLRAMTDGDATVARIVWLLQIARRLEIPLLCSEQYPQGIGPTVTPIRAMLRDEEILTKTHFDCSEEPAFQERFAAMERRQWVVVGTEAHVCVLQSALGLRQRGAEVYVVADAVTSRVADSRTLALERLRHDGVRVVNAEMVAFEWLHIAATDTFRQISRDFLR